MPDHKRVRGIHALLEALFRNKNWNQAVQRRFQTFYNKQHTPSAAFDHKALFANLATSDYLDDPRNADIFYRFWGIGRDPETLEQIGADYRISRERARQIKEKYLRILRYPSRSIVIRNNLETMGFFF
jgi:DNA-directed RNA polymerase sigma subunit (sigma70/sigma32)